MTTLKLFGNAIPCEVYVAKGMSDCTNNGVSSTRNTLWLVKEEVTKQDVINFIESEDNKKFTLDDFVCIKRRNLFGREYVHVEPIKFEGGANGHVMSGGNFLQGDSRQREWTGVSYPLSIHDRVESQELYNLLSI